MRGLRRNPSLISPVGKVREEACYNVPSFCFECLNQEFDTVAS